MDIEKIAFVPVKEAELPDFQRHLQRAFELAVIREFGSCDTLISEEEIRETYGRPNTEMFFVFCEEKRVGGIALTIDRETWHNSLDLLFMDPEYHSQGIGQAVWRRVESSYPDTKVWETVTPYFEKRNIHFYVNKCGFHITEFFHEGHPDPHEPLSGQDEAMGRDESFKFEKVMKE